MNKEKMMDMVIRKFGFDAEETIEFCQICEKYPYIIAKLKYLRLMRKG